MICILVPAKGISNRIHRKNLCVFHAKPLFLWSILAGLGLKLPVYVSTESIDVADRCPPGVEVIWRPPILSESHITDRPVIEHFLSVVPKVELLIYLRPTTPSRKVEVLSAAIDLMLTAGQEVTGLRSVQLLEEHHRKCFTISDNLLHPVTSWSDTEKPSQSWAQVWKPNGYIDICRGSLPADPEAPPWGRTVLAYQTEPVIEIDEPHHLEWATSIFQWPEAGD